ncbi:MAG: hypothetical protein K2G04_07515 [Oscillospiraceae bacterium]|nr:hypothetical protein [Oscillospiraceae bacterium]
MCREIIAITVLAAMLTGCVKGGTAEISETETVTTSVTSDTAIYCDESVFSDTEKTADETSEAEETQNPTVISADEIYSVYPRRIIYPEKTETNIIAEKAEINEELKKDGCTVFEFTAVYPVFSGGDAAKDIYPYLNEAGKSLFEGYSSAKSEPVNIIEKNGKKYFDTKS